MSAKKEDIMFEVERRIFGSSFNEYILRHNLSGDIKDILKKIFFKKIEEAAKMLVLVKRMEFAKQRGDRTVNGYLVDIVTSSGDVSEVVIDTNKFLLGELSGHVGKEADEYIKFYDDKAKEIISNAKVMAQLDTASLLYLCYIEILNTDPALEPVLNKNPHLKIRGPRP